MCSSKINYKYKFNNKVIFTETTEIFIYILIVITILPFFGEDN